MLAVKIVRKRTKYLKFFSRSFTQKFSLLHPWIANKLLKIFGLKIEINVTISYWEWLSQKSAEFVLYTYAYREGFIFCQTMILIWFVGRTIIWLTFPVISSNWVFIKYFTQDTCWLNYHIKNIKEFKLKLGR